MDRKCPQCQAPFLEAQRFCRYCGLRLDEGVQDYVETYALGQSTAPTSQPTEYTAGHPTWSLPTVAMDGLIERSRRSKMIMGVLVLVLLCGIGAGIAGYVASTQAPNSFSNSDSGAVAPVSFLGVNFDEGEPGGAFIDYIPAEAAGGPADVAGLIGGDLIVEAGGKPIRTTRDIREVLSSTPPGSELKIKFLRDGKEMEASLVTVLRGDFVPLPAKKAYGFFGIDPGEIRRVRVPGRDIWGVRLGSVLRNDPADVAGVHQGDIIIELNGKPIRTSNAFLRELRHLDPYSVVDVKIIRRGEEITLPVKLGRNE